MNAIITRLNEIEEKADAIISDARSRREQMMLQLEADKKEIDARTDREEQAAARQLRGKLMREGDGQIDKMSEKNREAIGAFERAFAANREKVAEEIFRRVIS